MNILYSTENLNTKRNAPYKNYFNNHKNCLILNIPCDYSFQSFSKKILFISFFKILFKKILANYKLLNLLKKEKNIDSIIILFPGIIDIIFLNIFGRKYSNLVIYDYFISFYQTIVIDRRIIKSKNLKFIIFHLEKFFLKLPNLLIVETSPIKDYVLKNFNNTLKINCLLTPISFQFLNLNNYRMKNEKKIDFIYWGTYINLHGLDILLNAAKLNNDNYNIYLLGDGQEYEKIYNLSKKLNLKNITFDRTLFAKEKKFDYFFELIDNSKIAIGPLSNSEKNKIVITSKVIEAAALNIPIISYKNDCIDVYGMEKNAYYVNEPLISSTSSAMKLAIDNYDKNLDSEIITNAFNWYKIFCTQESFDKNLFEVIKNFKNT